MLNDCSYHFEMIRLPVNGNKICNKPGIDAVKDVSPYQELYFYWRNVLFCDIM